MKNLKKTITVLAVLAGFVAAFASCNVASPDAGMAQTTITWIDATGAPPIDGKATLRLEFSEAVAGLTAELFSFIGYSADGKELSKPPAAGELTPDAVIVNEYTLTLTNVPAEPGGRIKISINKSNIKPADKWWNLDGTTDESFVMVKYSGAALYVGDTAALVATVYPSSAAPVWSSGSPEVATVDAAGIVSALSPGLTMITASVGAVKDVIAISVLSQPGDASIGIVWKGSLSTVELAALGAPDAGWAYYNTDVKKSYIYYGGEWHILAQDGADGEPGTGEGGVSIVWKGALDEAPANPATGWAYYDTVLKESRIWDGDSWETLSKDGAAGAPGSGGGNASIIVDPVAKTVVIPGVFSKDEIIAAIAADGGADVDEVGWKIYVKDVNLENADNLRATFNGVSESAIEGGGTHLNLSLCYGEAWGYVSGLANQNRISSVSLPMSVTEIANGTSGASAFKDFTHLTQVNAPGLTSIGAHAFSGTVITEADFPRVVSVGYYAFNNCSSLKAVILPKLAVLTATLFGPMGADNGTTTKNLEVLDVSSVLSIPDSLFTNDYSGHFFDKLKTVNAPAATSIGEAAFAHCGGLQSINAPAAEAIKYNAFAYTGITTVNFPKAAIIGEHAFGSCTALTSVNIWQVTAIPDYAFLGCTALATVNAPLTASIGEEAFKGSGITTANFPLATTIGASAFQSCTALKDVSIPKITSLTQSWFDGCTNIETLNIDSVTAIPNHAFQYCSALTTVSAHAATIIGSYAFDYCSVLLTADFPNVTHIGEYAFGVCTSLLSVNFPNVTQIEGFAFDLCGKLTIVDLPKVTFIECGAFNDFLGAGETMNISRVTLPANVEIHTDYYGPGTAPPFPDDLYGVYNNGGKKAGTYWRANSTWTRNGG